ncbi:Major Facilitator Superfamily protein, partial [Nonomuraea solani]
RHREPLMRLSIFHTPNLAAANLTQLLLGGAWIPMWFFLNLYLQQVLGYSAFPSGAALLPMTVLIMIGMITLAPQAINRLGPKPTTITGLLLLTAAMAWLSQISPNGDFATDVLPASLLAALGMSLAFIPSLGTAISSARPEEGGLASGIVNTSYQVGSALGLAAMTALAAANGSSRTGDLPALTNGFSAAFIGTAGIALTGALIAAATLRTRTTAPADELTASHG